MSNNEKQIVQTLLDYEKEVTGNKSPAQVYLDELVPEKNPESKNPEGGRWVQKNFKEHPHLFVIGCLMDKRIRSDTAWGIPKQICDAVGGYDFEHLFAHRKEIEATKGKKWNHRNGRAGEELVIALEQINEKYDGKANKIWDNVPPETIVSRFKRFKGIGPKISNMAAHILVKGFEIALPAGADDMRNVDISVDTHVKRVFGRIGLVEADADEQDITNKARRLYRDDPGRLDFPVFKIGQSFCKSKKPKCSCCPVGVRGLCQQVGVVDPV